MSLQTDQTLLIVVGAHLLAEIQHRPLAQLLRQHVVSWQQDHELEGALQPIVCTDLWYLNDTALLDRPAICVGEPGLNAATAFLANRLDVAFVVEDSYQIQLDAEQIDPHVCIWGVSTDATSCGVELFIERYLDGYLRSVHGVRA